MKNIKLTKSPYLTGGCIKVGVCELIEWYEAAAIDADGNEYRVIWKIKNGWDFYSSSDEDACDWDKPWTIVDKRMVDLSDSVQIVPATKFYRELRGLTQSELADKIGAYQKDICRWETGERNPDIESLKKLSIALDCKIDDLV